MPEEAGTYNLPLYVNVTDHPFVNVALDKASVNLTVVEANQ